MIAKYQVIKHREKHLDQRIDDKDDYWSHEELIGAEKWLQFTQLWRDFGIYRQASLVKQDQIQSVVASHAAHNSHSLLPMPLFAFVKDEKDDTIVSVPVRKSSLPAHLPTAVASKSKSLASNLPPGIAVSPP